MVGLMPLYMIGSNYYLCGQVLSKTTIAYFTESRGAEWLVAVVLFIFIITASEFISSLPKLAIGADGHSQQQQRKTSIGAASNNRSGRPCALKRAVAWITWCIIVAIMASPSIVYTMAKTLPEQHTWEAVVVWFGSWASLVAVAIDIVVLPIVVRKYAGATGIRSSMLLMTARMANAWLISSAMTLLLHENCFAG